VKRATARGGVDRVGAFASAACAVHCVLGAALPGALAAMGLGALLGHEIEWALSGAAALFALVALAVGWRRHRSWWIAAAFGLGVVCLGLARALEALHAHELGIALGVVAGAVLVASHATSHRACRRAADGCCEGSATERPPG